MNRRALLNDKIVTVSGETITQEKCKGSYLQELRVSGKSMQETYNGYQLLDISTFTDNTINGVTLTNNGDGSITITSEVDSVNSACNFRYDSPAPTLKPGTITLVRHGDIVTKPYIQVTIMKDGVQVALLALTGETSIISTTLTEEMLDGEITFKNHMYVPAGSVITPGTIKPMLYQDGDGTWEPYTGGRPMPSPWNPSTPIPAGGVMTTGAQLVNVNLAEARISTDTVLVDETGTVTFSGQYYFRIPVSGIEKGKTYTCSYVGDKVGRWSLRYGYGNNNIADSTTNGDSITISEDLAEDITYVYIYKTDTSIFEENLTFSKIMLNEGSVALPWEPYTGGVPAVNPYEGEINVSVNGKNLLNPKAELITTDFTPSYLSYPVLVDTNNIQTISIQLREGKSVPSGVYFGIGYKTVTGTAVSATWMILSGQLKANVIDNKAVTNQEVIGASVSVYPATQAAWDSVMDAFDVQWEYGDVATAYEPYHESQSFIVPIAGGLPGVPVPAELETDTQYTDENSTRWICDEIIRNRDGSGRYIKRIKSLIFNGNEPWTCPTAVLDGYSTYRITTSLYPGELMTIPVYGMLCSHFECAVQADYSRFKENICTTFNQQQQLIIRILNEIADAHNQTDVTEWKAWLVAQYDAGTPVTVWYPMLEPIITDLTAEELEEFKLHTYTGTTIFSNDSGAGLSVTDRVYR